MSYIASSDDDDYTEEEEEYTEEEEDLVHAQGRVMYTHDGLTEDEYKRSNVYKDTHIKRSECCHLYYKEDCYAHKKKYGLGIQGIMTCIHCYICFNSHKFASGLDLTPMERDCLKYYVENFSKGHKIGSCNRIKIVGSCILCQYMKGYGPISCMSTVKGKVVEDVVTDTTGDAKVVYADIIEVEKLQHTVKLVL